MLNLDVNKLSECWTEQKKFLKDGLVSGDIWDRSSGLSLVGVNTNPEFCALFNSVTDTVDTSLQGAGFPGLNKYYMIELDGNKAAVLINHDSDLLQGMLLDTQNVNLGVLFTVAIPKALAKIKEARM